MFKKIFTAVCLLAVSTSVVACGAEPEGFEEEVGGSAATISWPAHEVDLVVKLVNDPSTTFEVLDIDVGLDARAAGNIITHRNGPDMVYPSADDNKFDNIEELDAVGYVGETALSQLRTYAVNNAPANAEIVEGVSFTSAQAQAVVSGVNAATVAELDIDVALTSTAAQNLVANAPYASVTEIGAVSGVGPAALRSLRDYAVVWGAAPSGASQAGTYDGISFDDATAQKALSFANTATSAQLSSAGLYSGGVNAIVGGRPFSTLAQVSDTYGVGASTMRALHDWAAAH